MQQQTHQRDNSSPLRGGEYNPDAEEDPQYAGDDYEGDDQGSPEYDPVSKKLQGTRQARKQAQEDVKLLANRIALLKMEEKKAWKKIEDTKKKARDIMQVRQRNNEQQSVKEQRMREKEMEEKLLQERNNQMKQQAKDQMQMAKEQHFMKLKEEAERLKQEKREQQEFLKLQKDQEAYKNASMKQMIKNQEIELQERKRREQEEKKNRGRQDLINRILEENHKRQKIEAEVEKMEKEELDLIQKLQNTQVLQKAAYDDLEGALNGQISPEESVQQSYRKGESPTKSFGSSDQKGRPQISGGQGNMKITPQNAKNASQQTASGSFKSIRKPNFKLPTDLNNSQIQSLNAGPILPQLGLVKPSHKGVTPKLQIAKQVHNLNDLVGDKYQDYDTLYGQIKTQQDRYRSITQLQRANQSFSQLNTTLSEKDFSLSGVSKIVQTVNEGANVSNASIIGTRRIHEDGLVHLDAQYSMRNNLNQLQLMENRIKRLIFEEQRAKKISENAKRKAESMISARKRHQEVTFIYYIIYQSLLERFKIYDQRIEKVQLQKLKNQTERKKRYQSIKKAREQVKIQKKKEAEELAKEEKVYNEIIRQEKEDNQLKNQQKKLKVLYEKNQGLSHKLQQTCYQVKELKKDYSLKILDKQLINEDAIDRTKKLELIEAQLIERLKQTQSTQRNNFRNLEKVVSEGYDYYMNSFGKLKSKMDNIHPNKGKYSFYSRNEGLTYQQFAQTQQERSIEPITEEK